MQEEGVNAAVSSLRRNVKVMSLDSGGGGGENGMEERQALGQIRMCEQLRQVENA